MPNLVLCQGNALHLPLADASCHVCVTSPPYYGLRDYGTATWLDGDPDCQHMLGTAVPDNKYKGAITTGVTPGGDKSHCRRCGAVRVDQQLGLEASPDEYVAAMVQVFREVWRVLRYDGTLWINMGDSYVQGIGTARGLTYRRHTPLTSGLWKGTRSAKRDIGNHGVVKDPGDMGPKNLLGMPWRTAFALQADGWTLRSDIIWDKPSVMPESVLDRPTRSHEYVFLFSKQARYYYDAEAIREPQAESMLSRYDARSIGPKMTLENCDSAEYPKPQRILEHGRNARTVWRIASEATSFAHFATFPTALVRRCLLAGTPIQVCAHCGAPWKRQTERSFRPMTDRSPDLLARASGMKGLDASRGDAATLRGYVDVSTTGFSPTCDCLSGTQPATILDPFCGSGTSLLVARELGHNAVGVDLSWPYLKSIARRRLGLEALHDWQFGRKPQPVDYSDLPLFGC